VRLQMSLLNFLQYNVAGGGKSALYGVEAPTYYLRNGINQLQLVLPLALTLPLLMALAAVALPAAAAPKRSTASGRVGSTRADGILLWCVSPVFLWLAAISALPHKEERFLYVVYPLVRLSLPSFAFSTQELAPARLCNAVAALVCAK